MQKRSELGGLQSKWEKMNNGGAEESNFQKLNNAAGEIVTINHSRVLIAPQLGLDERPYPPIGRAYPAGLRDEYREVPARRVEVTTVKVGTAGIPRSPNDS
jgi:hypothetical protein